MLSVVLQEVLMLNVIMQYVIMPSVVVPYNRCCHFLQTYVCTGCLYIWNKNNIYSRTYSKFEAFKDRNLH